MGRAYDLVEEVIHRLLIAHRAEGLDDGTEPLVQATYLLKLIDDLRGARGEESAR